MNILITICARGGSKGIPRKNIKTLAGKPLIAYTIDTANRLKKHLNARVDIELSTDSQSIIDVAANFGLQTNYTRPKHLATDGAGKLGAIIDLKTYSELQNNLTYDFVIDLDVSSPLRSVLDVKKALNQLLSNPEAFNIFSVNPANRNPYFNLVEKKENGYYREVKNLENSPLSRQTSPVVFDMNASFYIFRKSFFEKGFKSAITEKSMIFEMDHICFDLDEKIDFEFMDYLLSNERLTFNLLEE